MRYRCIVADPPWSRSDGDAPVKPRRNEYRGGHSLVDRFPTMRIGDIRALPIGDVADDRSHLWMWSLNTTMEQAYTVVRAWGFAPKGLFTWCKSRATVGRRMYAYTSSEQLILATRGTPAILPATPEPGTWHEWKTSGTWARKPEDSFAMIERVSEGPRLELFARRRRPGWDAWGNEVDGIDLHALGLGDT